MNTAEKDIVSQIEQEHEEIKRDLELISAAVMENMQPHKFSDWRLKLIGQLWEFKTLLLKHFEVEEKQGFMEDVLRIAPQVSDQVENLKDEHEQIVSDLNEILAELDKMHEKDFLKLDILRKHVKKVVKTLHKHESVENSLMQKTYYRYQEYGYPGAG